MATQTIPSRLIGRTSALADAAGSRPSLALVAGESGVGKRRLICELGRRAGKRGVRVLEGECVELLHDGTRPLDALPASRREIARLLRAPCTSERS